MGTLSSLTFEDLPPSRVFVFKTTSTTLFPLSRGVEGASASASTRGMAAIGGGELGGGLGEDWTDGVDGVVD